MDKGTPLASNISVRLCNQPKINTSSFKMLREPPGYGSVRLVVLEDGAACPLLPDCQIPPKLS